MKKTVKPLLTILVGAALGAAIMGAAANKTIKKMKAKSNKHLDLFIMMGQWVKLKQEGKKLASYFEENGYKRIAIYGLSYAGRALINELKDSDITVVYGIDRNSDSNADVEFVSPDDELEPVDAVVVTAITFFNEIADKLSEKVECPIISLEDILYEV